MIKKSGSAVDWVSRANRPLNIQLFIDGRRCDGQGARIAKYSPRDGSLMCEFGAAGVENVEAAIAGARRAFEDGRWSRSTVQRRKDVLFNLASLIEKYVDELALLESLDVGKPIRDCLRFDVPASAAIVRFNAEAADKVFGRVYSSDRANLSYQHRRPAGVVGGIVGWNFPLVLAATKLAPALAAGNSLVLKPSELTSLSAVRLADLAIEAGVPEGVFNVIHGSADVGAVLARHGLVDLLTFTGSTQTGKRILISAGQSNMKRLILECGGKAASIVFDDAPDLDAVARAVVARAFWNQGQVCTASSRLLIQSGVKDKLLPLIVHHVAALEFGDPLRIETKFGPLVSRQHKEKVLGFVGAGQREGAKMIYRSDAAPPHESGYYVPPIIFDDVSSHHQIAREEIFGPVLSVMTFRDDAEAIRLANDTIYGLSVIIWTQTLSRALRAANEISAGWITVNATAAPDGGPGEGALPVGGLKESGMGALEGGVEGLEAYTSSSTVQLFT